MNHEHQTMLSCTCAESDRLTAFCLACGRVHAPDPSWFVIGTALLMIATHAAWWVGL